MNKGVQQMMRKHLSADRCIYSICFLRKFLLYMICVYGMFVFNIYACVLYRSFYVKKCFLLFAEPLFVYYM